jgi:hypothetical protein
MVKLCSKKKQLQKNVASKKGGESWKKWSQWKWIK